MSDNWRTDEKRGEGIIALIFIILLLALLCWGGYVAAWAVLGGA